MGVVRGVVDADDGRENYLVPTYFANWQSVNCGSTQVETQESAILRVHAILEGIFKGDNIRHTAFRA